MAKKQKVPKALAPPEEGMTRVITYHSIMDMGVDYSGEGDPIIHTLDLEKSKGIGQVVLRRGEYDIYVGGTCFGTVIYRAGKPVRWKE